MLVTIQVLVFIVVLFIGSSLLLHSNFKSISHGRAEELYDVIDPIYPVTPLEDEVELPKSMKRYLAYSKSYGIESTVTCRLALDGEFHTSPGAATMPAEGRVFLNFQDYSFVSFIEAKKNPIVKIGVRESFQYGEGRYEMKKMGMSGIATVRSKQLTTSEIIHYLSYLPFGSTMSFDDCFSFEEVSEGKVIMSYDIHDDPLKVEWRIDESGRITHLICVRPMLRRHELLNQTWVVEYDDYKEFNEMMMPSKLSYKVLVDDQLATQSSFNVTGVDVDSENPSYWKMD